jgi:hypothetical protein
MLEIDVGKRLPVVIADDEALRVFDRPMTKIVRRPVVRYQLQICETLWVSPMFRGWKNEEAAFDIGMHSGDRAWSAVYSCLGTSEAGFQAKGITEKAYVADCRAGTAPTPAAAPAPTAAAPAPSPMTPTPAAAGQTAKTCTEEWRADKAGFQAKGITEKAYVAACRAGTVATPATAPALAPTTAAPAPAPAPTAATPAPPPSAQTPYGTITNPGVPF